MVDTNVDVDVTENTKIKEMDISSEAKGAKVNMGQGNYK